MLSSLLAGLNDPSSIVMLCVMVALIAIIIVFYVLSSKKRKKQDQDAQDLINAVKPGNKVKTIGGICGIVVEVDNEENTFVLETGTELSGKSFIKFDRQAIYQTDAVVEKNVAKPENGEAQDAPAEEKTEEAAPAATEPVAAKEEPAEEVKPEKGKNDAENK